MFCLFDVAPVRINPRLDFCFSWLTGPSIFVDPVVQQKRAIQTCFGQGFQNRTLTTTPRCAARSTRPTFPCLRRPKTKNPSIRTWTKTLTFPAKPSFQVLPPRLCKTIVKPRFSGFDTTSSTTKQGVVKLVMEIVDLLKTYVKLKPPLPQLGTPELLLRLVKCSDFFDWPHSSAIFDIMDVIYKILE
jgi:hypothetical protein